jgi:hypothetical protein
MPLDMQTISAVNVAVTAVLGIVLIFTWTREKECAFVGWWGLALLAMSAGVVMTAAASATGLLIIGMAAIILSDAIKWKAAREFADAHASPFSLCAGPAAFLLLAQTGYLESFDDRLGALCIILSLYNFAAAFELSRADGERLVSRWPAVTLLVVTGLGYLSWLPLNFAMPIHESRWVFTSVWCFASLWPSSCLPWPRSARNTSSASKP